MEDIITQQKKSPKKWYHSIWSSIKKGAKLAYKGIVSNTGTLIISGIGLGLGIATGGVAPIALAAVVLGVKVVKTGLDAHKAIKTRSLDIENSALVDFATALYVQQKTLELQPKLLSATKNLTPLKLDPNNKKRTYNKTLNNIHKIVKTVDAGLDIATVVIDPTKGVHAAKHIKTGIDAAEKVKSILEVIGSTGEILDSASATHELYEMLSESLSHHPDTQEQLVDLINSSRSTEGSSYLNIEELRKQTQEIKNVNQALVATLKEDEFYTLTPTQIRDKFNEHLQKISSNAPPVQKRENLAKRIWRGVVDVLNPYSKYHPDVQKHSGLTTAMRKEKTNTPTDNHSITKGKAVTQDDFALNMKKKKHTRNTTLTREQEIAQFKKQSKEIDSRLRKTSRNIGDILHSDGHSQSATAKSTRSKPRQNNNSEKSR